MTRLEFLGTGCAGSDYLDVITRRGDEAESLAAFAGFLQSNGRALHLDHLLKALSNAADLVEPLAAHGWTANAWPSGECPFAKLQGHTWDTYLDTLAASHRSRFRRYVNTLNKKFDVRLEQAVENTARQEALESLIRFHEQRWGGRGGSSAFKTASLRAFHHDVTARALDSGWLRLAMLRLDDAPAAVSYCFSYNHRVYLYQHGFDSRFRQFSVGLVMLGLTIKAAIEEGAAEFDMLYGLEPYKWLWAQEVRHLSRIDLFPPHIAGRLHHRTLEAERTVRTLARRIFPRRTCDSHATRAGAAC
jgi:CelD/BcsL family acetyltransferase involved in cellulose biosynthesis